MHKHVHLENNILFQKAKRFTELTSKTITLDLRPMPPFERHTKIFELWEALEKSGTLRFINDHDPRPLHYQFEAELTDKYIWNKIEDGPKDWIVDITKK
ncbi:MAG: DUF2249 domain-containing protein [Candidatus Margulisiibacteriota bacterium]